MKRVRNFAVIWFFALAAGPLIAFGNAAVATPAIRPSPAGGQLPATPTIGDIHSDAFQRASIDATETVARARLEGDYVALVWEPVPDAASYVIYRLDGDSARPVKLTQDSLDGTSYIDMHPPQGEHLRYVIQPLFAKGANQNVPAITVSAIQSHSFAATALSIAGHGPNDVISDADFQASVSLASIRTFLTSQNSFLARNIVDYGGATIDPAQVISNAAAQNSISPWVIVTMLEKEMSVVTMTSSPGPNSTAIKCAMGYGCDKVTYAGFANQVNYAARSLRGYLTNLATTGNTGYGVPTWKIGVAHATEDCLTVTPANGATAALYTYNPLAGAGWGGCKQQFGANYRFCTLFYSVFGFGVASSTAAEMQSPTAGSTLSGSSQLFLWKAGQGVTQGYLYVGRTYRGDDIYSANTGTATSVSVTNIPTNSSTIYVTLWSFMNGNWQPVDYQYKAASNGGGTTVAAQMQSPATGSTLSGATTTFIWNGGQGVSMYYLWVSTTYRGSNIYGANTGTATSVAVANIPTNGSRIYVTLWSLINGNWQGVDYQYNAASIAAVPAQMQSPGPGSTLSGSTHTFIWNSGQGASMYYLWVSTTYRGYNIYGANTGTATSVAVANIPTNGSRIYVTLWSLINGNWQGIDYQYNAANIVAFPAQMLSPAPGSTLSGATHTFSWNGGQGVSMYYLFIGTYYRGSNIYGANTGTGTSAAVANLPTNGSTIYATLWSWINGNWQAVDYQYHAAFR